LSGILGSVTAAGDGPAAFPRAERLAGADTDALRGPSFSRAKAKTIITLGGQVATGEVDLESLLDLDDGLARDLLVGLARDPDLR
jgi:3-methyladenine DNA glycosylase/8-oxoguanine DNA glycosylase